ncbi:hypothetical protein Leryth_011381 [Lithospermum erythrorhizon]|nr:hypothetical protein Leryth_011381 [Lithospermum erythrorhizon]
MREMNKRVVLLLIAILVQEPCLINADTDPKDADAVRIIYSSLNLPQQLSKWTANGGDPCGESWKGITCKGSRVTEIDLSGLQLTGGLGYQVQNLDAVTKLDLSNNNFGNQIPYQFPPNLQRLNLANSGYNGGFPYAISQLKSLNYLDISHNQFSGEVGIDFSALTDLSTMDLSSNSLSGNLPNSFSSLSSLSNLYLQNNRLTGSIDVLANLPLDNLNIENNRFTGWVPDQLKGIKNLKTSGNSWNSGPAPPPPPGTPPARKANPSHKSGNNGGSSDDGGNGGGSSKSGIGAGGIAGIVISILVVGAIAAFFIVKRRSRKPSTDIEKLDNQPFAPLASQEVQEFKSVQTASSTKTFEVPAALNLKPPPVDRNKSFDDNDVTAKPIIPAKKINTASINALSYSIADLQIATDSFSGENLIGEGSIGRVYRAQFNDGKVTVFSVSSI